MKRLWVIQLLLLCFFLPFSIRATDSKPAKGHFLVATTQLSDPKFAESVVLLIQHDNEGSLGLIINHPTQVTVRKLYPDIPLASPDSSFVYIGGPVGLKQTFLLMQTERPVTNAMRVFGDVYAAADLPTIKEVFSKSVHVRKKRMFLGYAGWGAGQLEWEIAQKAWDVLPADEKFLFDVEPADIWKVLHSRVTMQQI